MDKVIDFINMNRDRYLDELKVLLAIPSISALPEHADDVKRCASWCADEMRRIGLQNVRLIDTPGNPVVYGDRGPRMCESVDNSSYSRFERVVARRPRDAYLLPSAP